MVSSINSILVSSIEYPVSSIQYPVSSIQYSVSTSTIQYPHPLSSIQYPVSIVFSVQVSVSSNSVIFLYQFSRSSIQYTYTQHWISSIQYSVSSSQYPVSGIQYSVSSIQYPESSIQYPVSSIQYPHPLSSIQYPVSIVFSVQVSVSSNPVIFLYQFSRSFFYTIYISYLGSIK